jgi:V/A-type H+-transporting ATPase subunit D
MKRLLKVPATKSALISLKRQTHFLAQGHDMLERKRELLWQVVQERLSEYRNLREAAKKKLEEAYRWLAVAELRMGSQVRQASLGLKPAISVQIIPRSSIGVQYPAVTAKAMPLEPVGLMWTDASFDEARLQLADLGVLLARLGEAETALRRLLTEQRKTQKRVNALKYNIIPTYRATIHFIQSALEEEERNDLFQMKVLRESRGILMSGRLDSQSKEGAAI